MKTCADIPFGDRFGKHKVVPYFESIYVGYRYFDKVTDKIRYPFGHGLSYTTFQYSNLNIRHENGKISATLTITNTGDMDGAEIDQLYVGKQRDKGFQSGKGTMGLRQNLPCRRREENGNAGL